MKNTIADSKNGVLAQSIKAENGAAEHETTLGIKHMTAAVLSAFRTAALVAINAYQAGKEALANQRTALQEALDAARAFAILTRDNLKPTLGNGYSRRWDATGYIGKLKTPYDVDGMLVLLLALKNFFTANPSLEIASRNITTVQAQTLYDDLSAAVAAVNSQQATLTGLKNDQDTKLAAVSKSLRDLINELSTLMGSMDPRWKAFGFNLPGAEETPDQVQHVVATLIGATAAAMKWDATPRASYYRVWRKVVGVDAEPVAVGSPADLDFTMEGLPTGSQIEIYVSAVNNGGEGPLSVKAVITTHA